MDHYDGPDLATAHRDPPATSRGVRTRASIVSAARTVFERDGYVDARLVDITTEAGCAVGSFYTYFSGKEEVLAAVLEDAQRDMMNPGLPHVDDDADPAEIIEASNRAYFTSFSRNAKIMNLLDQVSAVDPAFQELRRRRGESFARRSAQRIIELQERGWADPDVDPMLTALALNGMVARLANYCFVLLPDPTYDLEDLVRTCTRLWINGLRKHESPPASTVPTRDT